MPKVNSGHVFLNVPFDPGYEPLFISLIGGIVWLGLTPRCVAEIPESGHGRLAKLHQLISSCGTSIHDLSRVNMPVRFNMPFELGLACSIQNSGTAHNIVVLERRPFRLLQTLSDYNGRDPIVHNGSKENLLLSVLDAFDSDRAPRPEQARRLLRLLSRAVPEIKHRHRPRPLHGRAVFKDIVTTATMLAVQEGLMAI